MKDIEVVKSKIHKLQEELNKTIETSEKVDTSELLALSRLLDDLINEYYQLSKY